MSQYFDLTLEIGPAVRFSEVSFFTCRDGKSVNFYNGRILHNLPDSPVGFLTLFACSVARYPEHPALISGDTTVSYRQLDDLSNRIATFVRRQYLQIAGKEIAPGTPVGICLGRECNFVVALLGILKAGAAYVPLDPANPPSRLSLIGEDCGLKIVLTSRELVGKYGFPAELYLEDAEKECPEQVLPVLCPCDTAYIIYTSGTTGLPKGVPITYLNLHFLIRNALKWLQITTRAI